MEIQYTVVCSILITFIVSVKTCNRTWGFTTQGIEPRGNVYSLNSYLNFLCRNNQNTPREQSVSTESQFSQVWRHFIKKKKKAK